MNEIETVFTTIVASMLFSFAIAFPIIHLLYKFGITRKADVDFSTLIEERKGKVGTPIMGGLIVIITISLLNMFFNPHRDNDGLLLLILILNISALLGGIDDVLNIHGWKRKNPRAISRTLKLIRVHKSVKMRAWLTLLLPWELYKRFFFMLGSNPGKGIQAHEKIIIQSITGLALGAGIFYYSSRENPGEFWVPLLDFNLDIGILIIPFAWIAVLLMTNAVNLSDGMDGLSSSLLMSSFLGFLLIALFEGDMRIAFLLATIIGSLISYLYFNVPPARFQMGDVGSLALGTVLAGVAFMLGHPLMLLIISAPFAITLLSAIVQGLGRRFLGRRIFRMAPIHYHLQMKHNWSEEKVVMRLALFGVVCTILGVWIYIKQQ